MPDPSHGTPSSPESPPFTSGESGQAHSTEYDRGEPCAWCGKTEDGGLFCAGPRLVALDTLIEAIDAARAAARALSGGRQEGSDA